jgi:hypothetical protein
MLDAPDHDDFRLHPAETNIKEPLIQAQRAMPLAWGFLTPERPLGIRIDSSRLDRVSSCEVPGLLY